MASPRRKKPSLPRRKWTRSPAQKPHSTPKGKKGYDRKSDRKRLRDHPDDDA